MTPVGSSPAPGRDDEIAALVAVLDTTERRLIALTAGEVDSVTDRQGHIFVLRRAQEQLRYRADERQAAILDALPAQIALIDRDGGIVSVNARWSSQTGSSGFAGAGFGIGLNYFTACSNVAPDPSLFEQVATGLRSVLGGTAGVFAIDYSWHTPTQQRWYQLTVTPLAGLPATGAIVMQSDITERAVAEATRLRTATLLQAVVDGTPDHVSLKDVDGNYLLCNQALAAFMGLTPAQYIGRSNASILARQDLYGPAQGDRQVIETGTDNTSEYTLTGRSGPRTFLATKAPYRDASGALAGVIGISRDITDLKRDRDALRESQTLLGMSGRLAQVGGWSVNLPPTRVVWTDALAVMHEEAPGYSPTVDKALGHFCPEHQPAMRAAFNRCVEDGTSFDDEHQIITATGRRVWVRALGEAMRNEHGDIVGVQGALQDLTERRNAEDEARRMTTRLVNTLESITDGFFTVDRDWHFTYVNSEAERVLKVKREDLIGQAVWTVFPEAVGTEFEHAYRRAMAGEIGINFEARYAPWNAWISVNCYPSDEGLSVYFRDVTVKRSARRQLELLEASVSRLNDMVLITEVGALPAQERRIVFANDAYVRTSGYAREELLGRSPYLLHGPLTDAAEIERIRVAGARFDPVHAELLSYRKNRETYWVEIDVVPVRLDDEAESYFVSISRDITERKHDQDALRDLNAELEGRVRIRTQELELAREEAEDANRAKSSFLAAMSHEIRTPMNGVVGLIDVLEQSPLKSAQSEIVRTIRDSAYALLGIVDDILDFSKIEAGHFTVESEPMSVAAVVEGVCDTLDGVAGSKGVELTLFTDPALPAEVLGDATRLRQVLLNLVGNAIKFSSDRDRTGRVRVRAGLAADKADGADQPVLELTVADNGIGMSPDVLATLFTPFNQADASTTRRFGGTGLGLSISKSLVQMMGGEITARSDAGTRSVFTVRLPVCASSAGLASALPTSDLSGLNCLVQGSGDGLPGDLCAYLSHAGARVTRSGGRQASHAWFEHCAPGRWVVIIDCEAGSDESLTAMPAGWPSRPDLDVRLLLITRGLRRIPRTIAPNALGLDRDVLHRTVFLKAVAVAAGRVSAVQPDESPSDDDSLPSARAPLDTGAQCREILVAEDNEVNQLVLRKQLALLGFSVRIARDGLQALDCLREQEYPLLLTDLHMPAMDGYELATAIREAETREGRRRMPIVALTANAQSSESRRCRDIGMDDYMTKPVQLARLKVMLARWLPAADPMTAQPSNAAQAAMVPMATASAPPADLDALTALVGNDAVVIDELLELFRVTASRSAETIRQASTAGDRREAGAAAHSLKSAARAIGAVRLGDLCEAIEQEDGDGRGGDGATLLLRFEAELAAVFTYLRGVRAPNR